jgi:macrolide transport system ATP-binding/permease protein
VVLCCLGGLVGVAFSWLGAQALNAAQDKLFVSVSWAALGVAFAVSSAVGLVFGTVPARRDGHAWPACSAPWPPSWPPA